MTDFICNSDKYKYSKGYIHMPVSVTELPLEISIEGEVLKLKSSFHVSLVCVRDILKKHSVENLEQKILDEFCNFVSANEIAFERFTGEIRFASSEERRTLVARCDVSNLEKFSTKLSEKLNIEIPRQPTHVTLYTLQPDLGIGLNSFEELEQKSKRIEVPAELKVLIS